MKQDAEQRSPTVKLFKRGLIGEIRLNRPEVLNAMGHRWPEEMLDAATKLQEDDEIRAVLLTGEGRSFCTGIDLTQLGRGEIPNGFYHAAELAFRVLETMNKPVIAGVQGYCIGGGLQLAIACDARITTEDAVFGVPAAQEAFIPGMSTHRLPRLVGMGHARHLILSGETVSADEAYRIGLVNKVVSHDGLEGELEAWAERYAKVPRVSIAWCKRLSNQAFDLPFERFLEESDQAIDAIIPTDEHQAARMQWLESRGYGTGG